MSEISSRDGGNEEEEEMCDEAQEEAAQVSRVHYSAKEEDQEEEGVWYREDPGEEGVGKGARRWQELLDQERLSLVCEKTRCPAQGLLMSVPTLLKGVL